MLLPYNNENAVKRIFHKVFPEVLTLRKLIISLLIHLFWQWHSSYIGYLHSCNNFKRLFPLENVLLNGAISISITIYRSIDYLAPICLFIIRIKKNKVMYTMHNTNKKMSDIKLYLYIYLLILIIGIMQHIKCQPVNIKKLHALFQ